LGSFDFPALQQAHRVLGPIFFLAYVFFVFFVLLNMFLAIINDTYMEVKAELQNKKNAFDLSDYVKQGYAKMRERLTAKHDRITDIRKALSIADINSDKRLDFEEWRNEMKSRGYADEEIETMFAKYDTDGDRVLDENEQQALSNDLSKQKDEIIREMKELNMSVKNR
jgi:polycystin 2